MKIPQWYRRLSLWVEGDAPSLAEPAAYHEKTGPSEPREEKRRMGPALLHSRRRDITRAVTNTMAVISCIVFTVALLAAVVWLPMFGGVNNPTFNETAGRYIEQGVEEVGAANLVTNIILVYRGFDTFGESCVLFLAATAVIILLETDKNNTTERDLRMRAEDELYDAENSSQILRNISSGLMPFIVLFGLYVLFNGHLSPGGGFAGGSILGGVLILCENAFGGKKVHSFFGHTVYHAVKVGALVLYAILIGYTIFVGANGIDSIAPLGTPGSILSAGIILPINVAVGLEVACTMYAFYAYFRKGDL